MNAARCEAHMPASLSSVGKLRQSNICGSLFYVNSLNAPLPPLPHG